MRDRTQTPTGPLIEKDDAMYVKRIDEPSNDALVLSDLQPGDCFVFPEHPAGLRQWLGNNNYLCLDDWMLIQASAETRARHVTKLELAGTDGQTLLLRRVDTKGQ